MLLLCCSVSTFHSERKPKSLQWAFLSVTTTTILTLPLPFLLLLILFAVLVPHIPSLPNPSLPSCHSQNMVSTCLLDFALIVPLPAVFFIPHLHDSPSLLNFYSKCYLKRGPSWPKITITCNLAFPVLHLQNTFMFSQYIFYFLSSILKCKPLEGWDFCFIFNSYNTCGLAPGKWPFSKRVKRNHRGKQYYLHFTGQKSKAQ